MQKPIPVIARPDNYCAFNGRESAPYQITRNQAAESLWSTRAAARRGSGRLTRHGPGHYTLIGFNTLVLTT